MFCSNCGSEISDRAVICVKCGVESKPGILTQHSAKSRVAFVLLGLFLGGLGIHNFYAGYTGRGVAQLLITLCIGWTIVPLFFVGVWVLVEICAVTTDSRGDRFT